MLQNYDLSMNNDDDRRLSSFLFVFFGRERCACTVKNALPGRKLSKLPEEGKEDLSMRKIGMIFGGGLLVLSLWSTNPAGAQQQVVEASELEQLKQKIKEL